MDGGAGELVCRVTLAAFLFPIDQTQVRPDAIPYHLLVIRGGQRRLRTWRHALLVRGSLVPADLVTAATEKALGR